MVTKKKTTKSAVKKTKTAKTPLNLAEGVTDCNYLGELIPQHRQKALFDMNKRDLERARRDLILAVVHNAIRHASEAPAYSHPGNVDPYTYKKAAETLRKLADILEAGSKSFTKKKPYEVRETLIRPFIEDPKDDERVIDKIRKNVARRI